MSANDMYVTLRRVREWIDHYVPADVVYRAVIRDAVWASMEKHKHGLDQKQWEESKLAADAGCSVCHGGPAHYRVAHRWVCRGCFDEIGDA